MSGRLAGQVALITGSTRGIGEAIARRFVAEGASVVVTGRSEDEGARVTESLAAAGGAAHFVRTDVSVESDVEHAVAEAERAFGKLTTLVNNAAPTEMVGPGGVDTGVADLSDAAFDRIASVALNGMLHCCRHAVPAMTRAGGGSILNISSAASMLGVAGTSAYTATKGAMNALTRQMAVEYAARGIRSNALVVGFVLSSDMARAMAADPVLGSAMRSVQLTRLGEPDDIAQAATFLVSGEAAFITGALLAVDGGLTARMAVPDVSAALAAYAGDGGPS